MTGERTRQQRGYIFRKGKYWFVRYNDSVLRDGRSVRVQLCKKIAPFCDAYRSEKSVRALAAEILLPINANAQDVRGTMKVSDFIETTFLPQIKREKRASTYKNYRDIFQIHVRPRLGEITLRQFRCCDGEELLRNVARQAKNKEGLPLGHNTIERIKSFLSGTFKTARRIGAIDTPNPIKDTSVQGRSPRSDTPYYTLPEIKAMLAVLSEPAKTVALTAAFTGLRQGELRGLFWKDFAGKTLAIERSVWNGIVNRPKTTCSAASIPVVAQLRDVLESHRQRMGDLAAPDSPIFQSGIGTPMNLANLAKRVIVPAIEKCVKCRKAKRAHKPEAHLFELDRTLRWKGWHAFRRGLATTLHQLGVPDREIQAILRHSHVSITQASYIKSVAESQVNALDLVAAEMANDQSCNEPATKLDGPVN